METPGFCDPVCVRVSSLGGLVRMRAVCRGWRVSVATPLAESIALFGAVRVLAKVMGASLEATNWFMREGAVHWTNQRPCISRCLILVLAAGQTTETFGLVMKEPRSRFQRAWGKMTSTPSRPARTDVASWATLRFGLTRRDVLRWGCAPLRLTRDCRFAQWLITEFQLNALDVQSSRALVGAVERQEWFLASTLRVPGVQPWWLCECDRMATPRRRECSATGWLETEFGFGPDPADQVAADVHAGHYHRAHWLCDHAIDACSIDSSRDLYVLGWLLHERNVVSQRPLDLKKQMVESVLSGDLDLLKYLVDAYSVVPSEITGIMELAFYQGYASIVEFVRQRFALHALYARLSRESK